MTETIPSIHPHRGLFPLISQLGLFLLVLLVYSPSFTYDFVYDDFTFIVDNRAIQDWSNIPAYFTDPGTFHNNPDNTATTAWRPLRNISYLLDYKLFGLNPGGWHLHNILLHGLVTLLVFRLLATAAKTALPNSPIKTIFIYSWILAAAWALHPVNLEIAAWVKSRDDLLATLFGLISLLLFLRLHGKRGKLLLFASTCFLTLALLSKESVVLLPVISAGLYILLPADSWRNRIKNHRFLVGFTLQCAVTLAYLVIRHLLLGKTSQSGYLAGTFSHTIATMTMAGVRYLQLIFWPFWPTYQTTDYKSFPLATTWLNLRVLLSTLTLLLAGGAALYYGKRNRLALAGALFTLLAFLPVMNIIPMMQILAERFLYLPLIGVAMLLVAGLLSLSGRFPQQQTRLTLVLVSVMTLLAVTTLLRLPTWKNSYELYVSARNNQPDSPLATNNLAYFLWREGRPVEAIRAVDQFLARHPGEQKLMIMRASIYLAEDNTTAAKEALDDYERRYATNAEIQFMRSDLALRQERYEEAAKNLKLILQHNPKDSHAWYNLAFVQVKSGETTAARQSAQTALQVFPNLTEAKQLLKQLE